MLNMDDSYDLHSYELVYRNLHLTVSCCSHPFSFIGDLLFIIYHLLKYRFREAFKHQIQVHVLTSTEYAFCI